MSPVALTIDWGAEAEQRLLDFVALLILDVARTHSRCTQEQVALWLARVIVRTK